MATRRAGEHRVHPAWWTLIVIVIVAGLVMLTSLLFEGSLKPYVPVTLTSDRAGLVMESGGKVKMRGVQVGQVGEIIGGHDPVSLKLELYPDQLKYIPANVEARIRATTAFGAKYVDLVYPGDPSPQRLAAGAVIRSQNVSTEVNTVFENLVGVLHQIDPQKLNGVLAALSEGLRGQGPAIGQATTDANQVLTALNQRADVIRADWRSFGGFSDTYAAAGHDILTVLDAASTTSATITDNSAALDSVLTSVIGLSQSGTKLLAPNEGTLVNAVNVIEPTTALLLEYNPELTCMLEGGVKALRNGDDGFLQTAGGANGKSLIIDTALLLGDDPYGYPENLPVIGAKGGPGGKPSCGSLPDVAANFPQRYLVTNTGWGTGMDMRPNPGIGFPGWANYFPVTKGVPEPPRIRYAGGPAPGPIPYPGAPPYGAPMYAPDGTPLYPGEPPAPAPMAPRVPGPTPPGSEPFVVPHPAEMQPPWEPPIPQEATPSP